MTRDPWGRLGERLAADVDEAALLGATILALVATACGMLVPTLPTNDPYWFAGISRTMAASGDWVDLVHNGTDWLDKPHFPFWAAALSFRLFGVGAAAYILPGFLFHALGAFFTYRLARLFTGRKAALAAALVYATSLHLLLSAFDVRAEAYLLGQIVPACHYWILYDREGGAGPLLLGSLFTGLALMTKGPFVVLPIFGGLVALWFAQGRAGTVLRPKWLLAWLASLAAALPELVCLHLQFDAHPEKVVFGRTGVSGVAWYLWESQFGRFLNTAAIKGRGGDPFYFVHSGLWSFLPWSLLFLAALVAAARGFREMPRARRDALVTLHGSIWPAFLLFSASRFQLDHYANILLPFAAIVCALFLEASGILPDGAAGGGTGRGIAAMQRWTSFAIAAAGAAVTFAFVDSPWAVVGAAPLAVAAALAFAGGRLSISRQTLLAPAAAIVALFLVFLVLSFRFGAKYDAGRAIARALERQPELPVYVLRHPGLANSLGFHSGRPIRHVEEPPAAAPFHAVVESAAAVPWPGRDVQRIGTFLHVPADSIVSALLDPGFLARDGRRYDLIRVDGPRLSGDARAR